MLTRSRLAGQGFTLVEVLASIVVFSLVTLGVVPLLLSSIRGSTLSRSFTVGKNVTLQAMERARGLPYNRQVSSGGLPKRVDILDLYFPRGFGSGFAANTFTTVCTSTSSSPACPAGSIPGGYTVTYVARFVKQCQAANTASCDPVTPGSGATERYEVEPVPTTYFWQGTAAGPETGTGIPCSGCSDKPPAELLQLEIRTTWDAVGRQRNYGLTTLIGDRKFGGPKIDGEGRVEYVFQLRSSYNQGGQTSDVMTTAGASESRISSRLVSTASHAGRVVRMLLTDDSLPVVATRDESGAAIAAQAPPDVGGGAPLSSGEGVITVAHQDFGNQAVAGADASGTSGVQAGVAVDLPVARGTSAIATASGGSPLGLIWVNNQVPQAAAPNPLLIQPPATGQTTGRVAWLRPGTASLNARTNAFTNPTTSDRKVFTEAVAGFGSLRFFPTTFVTDTSREGAVLAFENFSASVSCEATAGPAASNPDPTGTYRVALVYWQEAAENNGATAGNYQTISDIGTAAGRTAFENLMTTTTPPMVYEDTASIEGAQNNAHGSTGDVYLFPVSHVHENAVIGNAAPARVPHDHPGYVQNWAARALGPENRTEEAGGVADSVRLVTSRIDTALSMTTAPLNPAVPESDLTLNVGSLSCSAGDFR